MPTKKKRTVNDLEVEDPEGVAWQEEASSRWRAAADQAALQGVEPVTLYDPVPLPDFGASRSSAVSREVLGRFVQDRASGIVHDVTAAVEACGVDGIANATFFHFWAEVVADPEVDLPCPHCLP